MYGMPIIITSENRFSELAVCWARFMHYIDLMKHSMFWQNHQFIIMCDLCSS